MKKRKVQVVIYYRSLKGGKIFLLLKMNAKRNFHWQSVTGSVDENETFEKAALREAVEETALKETNIKTLKQSELEFSFIDQWKKNVFEKVFYIECHDFWDVFIDSNEHCAFKWISEKELSRSSVFYESNYLALKEAKSAL